MTPALFLPFTPEGRRIEEMAIDIKTKHNLGPYEAVAPRDLAQLMDVNIIDPSWFDTLPEHLSVSLLGPFQDSWSAGSIDFNGKLHVLLNPRHAEARQTMTLGEELVHGALGHPKSRLTTTAGMTFRNCEHSIEDEAYSVAAALVMPYQSLFNHVNAGRPIDELLSPAPLSHQAREFRVKRAGLWPTYRARQRPPTGPASAKQHARRRPASSK